ncbi:MAG: SlyX family protein [Opitutaceae bacterium]
MSDPRLSDLESRFAWLERHVGEQDRAVLALSDELRRVREELRRLRARSSATPVENSDPETERPPHY